MAINKTWSPRRQLEQRYQGAIQNIGDKLWEAIAELEDPDEIIRALTAVMNTEYFARHINRAVSQMVTGLLVDSGRTWRQAARESSKGRMIYQALQRELDGPVGYEVRMQVMRNAQIIKTLPNDISQRVSKYVSQEAMKGRRASEIAEEIKKMFPEQTKAKANLIARTETSKTSTAITRARCDNLGLPFYIWRANHDSRVRRSHKKMDNVIIGWNDPPSPEELDGEKPVGHYHAGEVFNCRCYPEPITDINLVSWPHKVYMNGQIIMMTKAAFLQRFKVAA